MTLDFEVRYLVEPVQGGGKRTTCVVRHVPSSVTAIGLVPDAGDDRYGVAERLEREIIRHLGRGE